MIRYWILTDCPSSYAKLVSQTSKDHVVTACDFTNLEEVQTAEYCGGGPRVVPFPLAHLKITRDDFGADFFSWNGLMLVSEQMRQVMDLDPMVVRYFDVDASQSKPLARSKNYKIMEPVVTEDISDRDRSTYETIQIISDWRLQMAKEGLLPPPTGRAVAIRAHRIVVRPDVVTKSDLFYDKFFSDRLFCTEAFAMKILRSPCTGARFVDPEHMGFGIEPRFRTLRGIEEHAEWDLTRTVETTRLVHAIDAPTDAAPDGLPPASPR